MEKWRIKVAWLVILLVIILSCTGCLRYNVYIRPYEKTLKFKDFTQEERKKYICDFLKEEYDLSCEVTGDVEKRFDGLFFDEENFYATVKTADNQVISLWISDDGKIIDTVFMIAMESGLNQFFTDIQATKISEFEVKTSTEIRDIPSEKLTKAEDIKEFLGTQDTYSNLKIFVDDSALANEELLDELEKELNFCNGAIYLYVCEDLDQVDLETYDMTSYYSFRGVYKEM